MVKSVGKPYRCGGINKDGKRCSNYPLDTEANPVPLCSKHKKKAAQGAESNA